MTTRAFTAKLRGNRARTTVTNLSAGTAYVFNIWAYDLAGNKATATVEVSDQYRELDQSPKRPFITANRKRTESGRVDNHNFKPKTSKRLT